MNKIILSLVLGFFIAQINAQFYLTTHDEELIENGATFEYNTTDEATAKLGYIVHNDSDQLILMKAEIEEITGSDGSDFELCFGGSCYFSVTEGQVIPQSPVAIQPGGIQGMFDHMWNKSTASPYMTFKVRFYMIDAFGNEQGDPFYVNYIYNEELGVQDVNTNLNPQVKNTIIKNDMFLELEDDANISIYAMDGKLVMTTYASQGSQTLNLSKLSAGNYIVMISSKNGKNTSTKVVVK